MTPLEINGTIPQVEAANVCAQKGDASVAINSGRFCVMASVKEVPLLAESQTVQKIIDINANVGMTYAGFEPDFRILSKHVFKTSLAEGLNNIQSVGLRVSRVMQEMTHVCATRPFGLALILAGMDQFNYLELMRFDAYGQMYRCGTAAAVGIGAQCREHYLVEQYEKRMSLRSGLLMAIEALTLDETEKYLESRNFEIAVIDVEEGFRPICESGVRYVVGQVQCW